MSDIENALAGIESRLGVSVVDLRIMAAESEGVDYYPGLLLPGRLAHGISSLEVGLDATEIEPILTWHTKEQKELKTRFDLPFSEDERGIATGLLDELEPLKEPDQYALRDTILARFPESKKEITLSTIGRLSIRQVIKTGTRTTRHRGTFRFVKWHTPQVRRDYIHQGDQFLDSLEQPFTLLQQTH